MDFAPTICELLDADAPSDWDGESFAANLRGEDELDRDYLVWDHGLYTVQRAVRTKQHLMIQTYDDFGYSFEPVELYDMENDPYQSKNIRDERPDVVQQCEHHLSEWLQAQRMKGHNIPDPLQMILRERSNG